jgi:Tfp pilus assembly protein PilV
MTRQQRPRRGLSFLEVLVSLAIFLLALGALTQLMTISSEQALAIQIRSQAAVYAQSQLAKIASGIQSITDSVENTPLDEDSDYNWSMTSQATVVNGLYSVTVTVSRDLGNDRKIDFVMAQMILDPAVVGSNQDQSAQGMSSSSGSGSSGSSSGSMSTPSTSPSTPSSSGTKSGSSKAGG